MNDPKDVLITGASGVIGATIARHLTARGYRLHLTSRQPKKLDSLKREIAASHAPVFTYQLDLSNISQTALVIEEYFRQAPHPYGLICNAGNMGELGLFIETDFAAWSRGITENFLSHAAMVHRFGREFQKRKLEEGAVIVFSGAGVGGTASFSHMTSYSTAKAALVHFIEALSPELIPLGLTINAIAPGPVVSGMTDQALQAGTRAGVQAQRAEECKTSGGVSPKLAAEAVEFLLSDAARSVTGRLLSARFDMKNVQAGAQRVAQDSNLYRLRRIDGELFSPNAR